jgi:hypothetical protein
MASRKDQIGVETLLILDGLLIYSQTAKRVNVGQLQLHCAALSGYWEWKVSIENAMVSCRPKNQGSSD